MSAAAVATTYDTVVSHARVAPMRNRFSYRTRAWLVDLDRVPTLPRGLGWLARFEARDHLGSPGGSLRENIAGWLATQDVDVTGGRIVMLANARALGHVFNPISVHWCYDRDDALVAVVAEVHNTYGDRHAYLLRPGPDGRVDERIDKQMYVSPFNPVEGRYRIAVSEPGEQVSIRVSLERDGRPPFVASLRGTRRRPAPAGRAALGTATTSLRVSMLIRWQGIRLFIRGLRVEPRPIHPAQEAA